MGNDPFFSNVEELNTDQKGFVKSLQCVYKEKGYGEFLATFMSIKRGSLFTRDRINHIQYWILAELRIRYYAWKLCLKLKNKCARKKYPQNDTLLDFTTPVDSLDDSNTVYVYKKNNYWVFSVSEIKKILMASLTQRYISESRPKIPCNPYTNIDFSFGQLMSIYLQIGHLKLHPYIHNYAKRYFDIKQFFFFNRIELSNCATKGYLETLNSDYLYEIAEYFEYPFDMILKRVDIPADIKRGILKRVMNDEPIKNVFDLPICSVYNIHPFKYKARVPRHTRRARRIPRQVNQPQWPILPQDQIQFDQTSTE